MVGVHERTSAAGASAMARLTGFAMGDQDQQAVRPGESAAVETLRFLAEREFDDAVAWAIVDAAPDGLVLADQRGTVLLVNQQAEKLFGYGWGELLGRSVDDLLPGRLREIHGSHRAQYIAAPRTRPMGSGQTLFGRRNDGTEFPVEVSLSPLVIGGGLRIIAMVRDVSDRIALESEARRVKETLDVTRDAVLTFDADTLRFTYANQGAVDQVQYSVDELLEMTMLQITPEFDEVQLRELLAPVARGDVSSLMFTTTHRRRDGVDIPVEIILQATDIENGRPRSYVKIVRDITERLADEQRFREVEQGLRVMEDRDRIARDLHDVVIQRLFAIGLSVQAVQTRTSDAEMAQRLGAAVAELDETIRELRSAIFSLQGGGALGASGLRAQIERVIDEQKEVLGFEPHLRFDGVIDAVPEEVAAQLLPVLREVLSNIGRHAHASAAVVTVMADDSMTLRVSDNGTGIPDDAEYGNGIKNVTRRASDLGGSCTIAANAGGGTTLEWLVPIRSGIG
jgi:two-component system, NarL family, sensor histidine kinase DevS